MPPLSLHFGHRDKLELKAVKDGSASYAALEKKAELYEKLSRGELPDEEDKEKYCVDFFQKGFDRVYEPQIPECSHRATDGAEPVNDHEDSMPNAKPLGLGQAGTTIDRDEHKRIKKTIKILLYNQISKTVIHRAPPSFTYSLFFPIFFSS